MSKVPKMPKIKVFCLLIPEFLNSLFPEFLNPEFICPLFSETCMSRRSSPERRRDT